MDLDVDQFMKDMESVMGLRGSDKNDSDIDLEEGSSSDLDFGNIFSICFYSILNGCHSCMCWVWKLSAVDYSPWRQWGHLFHLCLFCSELSTILFESCPSGRKTQL